MNKSFAVKAENFDPDYLKINPNGAVPTVTTSALNTPLVDTRPILEYLDHARSATGAPSLTPTSDEDKATAQALIDLVHSDSLDTGLFLFGCLDDADVSQIKSCPLFDYLAARQVALKNHLSTDPSSMFYRSRLEENGRLHRIFTDASRSERDEFFRETAARLVKFADSFNMLGRHLRLPYAIGDNVSLADLHIVPWLSHSLWALGTTDRSDFSKLESRIQRAVPDFRLQPKVREWWTNFSKRDSFQEVFRELH